MKPKYSMYIYIHRMSSNEKYFYQCGTKHDSGEVHCIKSVTNFKNFDNPSDYGKIILLSLKKSDADKKLLRQLYSPSFVGAIAAFANAETGETRTLTAELNTSSYIIINK